MKQALKIIGYSLLSLLVLIGAVVGIVAINNDFGVKKIEATNIWFEQNDVMVIDDFFAQLNFEPLNATELTVQLTLEKGHNIVSIPSTVKAGEDFEIKLKKDNKGNNIGGEVVIKAQTKYFVVQKNFRFYVDVAIPLNGLMLESEIFNNKVATGSGDFSVYIFTDPALAIYPDSSVNTENLILNKYTYKNINIVSENPNSLKVRENTKKLAKGFYNPNYKINGRPIFSATRQDPSDIERRYIEYKVSPLTASNDLGVILKISSLRTYAMQEDFVDINNFGDNSQVAYEEFSKYIEKYRSFIEADTRAYESLTYNFDNGQEFINFVTSDGTTPVKIIEQNSILHDVAMYYLHLESQIKFSVENIKIKEIKAKEDAKLELFKELQLTTEELRVMFGIELVPNESGVKSDALLSKFAEIKLEALKGRDLNNDGILDRDEDDNIIYDPAGDMILIENPTNMQNPIWTIRAINPQTSLNDGLSIRVSVLQDGQYIYSNNNIRITIEEKAVGGIELNAGFFPSVLSTNKNLTNGIVNSVRISDNTNNQVYKLANPNATYNTVKFFVKKDSVLVDSYKAIRLSEDYSFEEIEITDMYSGEKYQVFEVTYSQIEALNVTNVPVVLFAGVIKTDYLGNPILEEDKNYILVQKSNEITFTITSYVEEMYYYTIVNVDDNLIFQKRSADIIKLLSNQTYTIYATNMHLDENGNFDSSHPSYNNENINYKQNLIHALRSEAGAELDDPSNITPVITTTNEFKDVLKFNTRGSQKLYQYDKDLNVLELTLDIQRRNTDITADEKVIKNTIYFDYKSNKPLNLDRYSRISIDIVFAKINNDLLLSNAIDDFTADQLVTISANATDGRIAWQHKGVTFKDVNLTYDYDIMQTNSDDELISNKIDKSLKDIQFVENYINYIEEFHLSIEWKIVSGSEYITIQPNGKKLLINFLKGLPTGAEAKIMVTVSLYPDNNGKPLQIKTQTLRFNIIQEQPSATLFTSRKEFDGGFNNIKNFQAVPNGTGNYSQINGEFVETKGLPGNYDNNYIYINEHLVENTASSPQQINGGITGYDILQSFSDLLPVYKYELNSSLDRAGFEIVTGQVPGGLNKKLINVYFQSSFASIIADSTFTIESENSGKIPAYFVVNGQKVYTARPSRNRNDAQQFELLLNTDNITQPTPLRIKITTSTGQSFDYHIMIESNLTIKTPTGNIAIINDTFKDQDAFDLNGSVGNELFKVEQKLSNGTVINLPVSFELANTESARFSELLEGDRLYSVGQERVSSTTTNIIKGGYGVILTENGLKTETFMNKLSIYQILSKKDINVKFYYYVPRLDADGNFELAGIVDDVVYPIKKVDNSYVYVVIDSETNEEVTVEYTDNSRLMFIFDKREYTDGKEIGAVVVNPSIEVVKGQKAPNVIRVDSGNQKNIYEVIFSQVDNKRTSDFIDIRTINGHDLLGDLTDMVLDTVFNYGAVYKDYLDISIVAGELSESQRELYNQLRPSFNSATGVISSDSINGDLTLRLVIKLREGKKEPGKIPSIISNNIHFEFAIMFNNNVNFKVSDSIYEYGIESTDYIKQIDTVTLNPTGHIIKDIMSEKNNVITLQSKVVSLYSYNSSFNVISLTGGNNADLLRTNINSVNLMQFDGVNYLPINYFNNSVVELLWIKNAGNTDSISLLISGSVNEITKYKVVLNSDKFDLGNKAEYYFEIHPNITLQNNYPVFADYEKVTNNLNANGSINYNSGTVIELNKSYINENKRTEITSNRFVLNENGSYEKEFKYEYNSQKHYSYAPVEFIEVREELLPNGQVSRKGDYNLVGTEYVYVGYRKGNYIATKFEYVGAYNGNYKQIDTGNYIYNPTGSETKYDKVQDYYELELTGDIIYLVNQLTNNKIKVVENNNSSSQINFFTYYLLDQNKKPVLNGTHASLEGTYPRAVRSNNGDAFVFKNIRNAQSVMYIRIELFNKSFIDYKIQLVENNALKESFDFKDAQNNAITSSNPIVVNANTQINLSQFIKLNNGLLSNLLVKYNNYNLTEDNGLAGYQVIDGIDEIMTRYSYLNLKNSVKFENVVKDTLVSFDVFGQNYTSGTQATKLYVRVKPNFEISNNSIIDISAGKETRIVKSLNTNTIWNDGILVLNGDVESDVTYAITEIDGVPYTTNNAYGIKISQDSSHFNSIILSNDINKKVNIKLKVTKTFDNNKEYTVYYSVNINPNIIVTMDYGSQGTNRVLTSTEINAPDATFITSENVSIKDRSGNEIIVNDRVQIEYLVFDIYDNPIETLSQQNANGIAAFDKTNGEFVVLKVNQTKDIKVKIFVKWLKDSLNATYIDPVIISFDYEIKIIPNINTSSIKVSYKPSNQTELNVQEGSIVELFFNNAENTFASQQQGYRIELSANQMNGTKPNFVLREEDKELYKIYSTTEAGIVRYFIQFKNLTSLGNNKVSLKLYLDLTKNADDLSNLEVKSLYYGVVKNHGQELYVINDARLTINFVVMPSVSSFEILSKYKNNKIPVNFGGPQYIKVKDNEGDFVLALEGSEEYFRYVGQNQGDYKLVLTEKQFKFVGHQNGAYNADGTVNEFGDYDLLSPNEFDLFTMIQTNLVAGKGLTYEDNGLGILIDKNIIRNSIKYEVQNENHINHVIINNGIVFFKTQNNIQTITIKLTLYSEVSTTLTLQFEVKAGGALVVDYPNDIKNSSDNLFEVNVNDTFDIKDYIAYGYQVSRYNDDSATESIHEEVNGGFAIVVRQPGSVKEVLVLIMLDKTMLSYYPATDEQQFSDSYKYIDKIVDGKVTFKSWGDGDAYKDIKISIGSEGVAIYIRVNKN